MVEILDRRNKPSEFANKDDKDSDKESVIKAESAVNEAFEQNEDSDEEASL